MSKRHFSPLKNYEKIDYKKRNRPFSSIAPRTCLHSRQNNNCKIFGENETNNIKYYVENNLYENSKNHQKISETKNNYNKLHKNDLIGKEKYTNFIVFAKREMDFKVKNNFQNKSRQKLTRQHSAIQLNPHRMYKDNPLYLTETIIKKHHKKTNNYYANNYNINNNNNNNNDNYFPYIEFGDKNENIIINNHKYKNISLLRQIENDKRINKSYFLDSEKNFYLFEKKLQYISLNKMKGKRLYNYIEDLNELIKKKFGNKLKAEKARINYEEYKNENELIDSKIYSFNKANSLYNDLFIYKYNDYIKFLGKQIDKFNKNDYYLLNDLFNLQKEVLKLKNKINKLLEDKKFFNKIIFLQICVQEKKIKLPDYYDYILNHSLEEGINHYKGNLKEKEVKHIFDYKKNIIYKDFESYSYQIKIYENENREMLNKLSLVRKEVNRLDLEKKELFEENEQISNYLDNKMKEKSKERIDIINKYNFLNKEKNKLLKQIQFSYVNENMIINKIKKPKKKNKYSFSITDKDKDKDKKILNKSVSKIYNSNIRNKISYGTNKKSLSIDEQLFLNFNINYDNPENKNQHTILYYKVRKLFFLLNKFIKKEENINNKEKITTENGLILKLLIKIEDAMNLFIENEKNFNRINKEIIIKIKMKMEKQRKIMKGQRQMAIIKSKYENMKKKLEEKNNKIYFIPNTRKRAVSAFISKKKVKKKEQAQLIKKKEFEDFLEDLNEDL